MSHHAEVLASAAQGDDEALATLVRAYHDRVYRYGVRVCRDGYDADDAVQMAFTKLSRRPEVARHPDVVAWLFTVVRRACLKMLRPFARARRALGERIDDASDIASEAPGPDAAMERWRLVQEVHRAISSLERPYREVLIMRDLEGLTGPETCTTLNITPATMKTRLHRARLDVRQALERRGVARERGNLN